MLWPIGETLFQTSIANVFNVQQLVKHRIFLRIEELKYWLLFKKREAGIQH